MPTKELRIMRIDGQAELYPIPGGYRPLFPLVCRSGDAVRFIVEDKIGQSVTLSDMPFEGEFTLESLITIDATDY